MRYKSDPRPPRAPLIRSRFLCRLCLTCLALSMVASLFLAALYRQGAPGALVYYFTWRPAWLWFAGALPLLAIGMLGARRFWTLFTAAVWLACFSLSEEVMPLARPPLWHAEREFKALKSASAARVDDAPARMPLRIVTWNLLGRKSTVDAELAQLAAVDPDIVCLQEVSRSRLLPDAIARSVRFSGYFAIQSADNAVLSRFPLEAVKGLRLPTTRGQVVKVRVAPGETVICVNVHMPSPTLVAQVWPKGGWSALESASVTARVRLSALGDVARRWADVTPVMVVGDFNTPGNYAAVKEGLSPLKDAFLQAGHGWGKTIPARLPMSRIDLLYLSREFDPVDCRALAANSSDHRAVMADVILSLSPDEARPSLAAAQAR